MGSDSEVTPDQAGGVRLSRRALLGSGAVLATAAVTGVGSARASSGTPVAAGRRGARSGGRARPIDTTGLQRAFQTTAKELRTPGALMVLSAPALSLSAAYGAGVLGGSSPIADGDHVRIGSVTKTFTGTVILQLVQRGKLSLEDPVSRFVPNVPNGSEITIEDLLSMHSGLYNYSRSLALNQVLDRRPGTAFTPSQLLAIAFTQPASPPGGGFDYCNTNTILLGLIAQRLLGGQPLPAMFRERLFAPLGMDGTTMPPITSSAIPAPHPRGYMYGTNVSTLETEKLPPRQLRAALDGKLKPHDVTGSNPAWAGAAGAAISTAADLVTWAAALVDGALLNSRWQRRRLSSVRSVDPSNPNAASYGLALARFGPLYGHTGEFPGFQTFVGRDPARKLTLVVSTNLNASPRGQAPAATIAQRLVGELYR